MSERTRDVGGATVPTFVYGTAWKEDRTAELVARALEAGFRGVDTANQRRHYHEALVGRALTAAIDDGSVARDDLFVQTKFTFRTGHDLRLPYDPNAPVDEQVQQSFDSSLEHLGLDRIDSYVLHGPSVRVGLGPADVAVWRAMEELHDRGRARLLGVSNIGPDQLAALLEVARVPPAFVQNRCFAVLGWDAEVRSMCDRTGIVYQAFSLLTANRDVLRLRPIEQAALRHRRSLAQIVFRFALEAGMIPLTGTTSPPHMAEDLAVYDFELDAGEVAAIEAVAGPVRR